MQRMWRNQWNGGRDDIKEQLKVTDQKSKLKGQIVGCGQEVTFELMISMVEQFQVIAWSRMQCKGWKRRSQRFESSGTGQGIRVDFEET